MCVDVSGGRKGAVPQPFLNLLHRYAVHHHQAGAAVAQIVETDVLQSVLGQQPVEVLRHEVRADQLAFLIGADEIQILSAVALLEQLAVKLLLFLLLQKFFFHSRDQRQGTAAGLVLHHIADHRNVLAVHQLFRHLVIDDDGLALKVDRRPLQPKHLAAAQTVVGCNEDAQVQGVILRYFQQLLDFILGVEVGPEAVLLRAVNFQHLLNKNEIRFLHNYYLGSQPVLQRTKEYHAEITNRIVENHANECVGFYTGYMSGTPCSYVRSETATGDGEEIARLSNALQYEGKDALDRRLWQWMLECGQGYRIVLPDKGYNGHYPDETPLLVDVPDPDMAYVIYNSGIGHKPIANVLHISRNYQNDLNDLICVYTPNQYFEIDNGKITKSENHSLGMLPMVEYKLNPERMGLFEPAIPVLDAINDLESNRLDGVAQFIQSIMVFTNCLVDKDALDQVKELGAMCLKSTSGLPASVSQIANELDQQQSQTLLDSMLNVYRSLTAMPSATGSENATSDNVGAVIVRNGWNHTEARAQQYENMFKYAERQSLSVMLKILRDTAGSKLMASDINIKLPRRQYDNQQSKVQIFAQMIQQPIDPQLAFTTPGLFPDPQAAYEMSKPFLIAAGKLGEDGKAPKPQEQQPEQVVEANKTSNEQSDSINKETEGE